jgi:hypothetical protein
MEYPCCSSSDFGPRSTVTQEGIRQDDELSHDGDERDLCGLSGCDQLVVLCLEAGKKRLAGDTARQATAPEVKELRAEAAALKEAVADLTLENRLLKKSMIGDGENDA